MKKKWSYKINQMLLLWLGQIGLSRKMHHDESVKMSNWDDRLAIIIIILSSITAITSFTNIIDFPKLTKNIISIIVGAIVIVIGIITGISSRMKLGELSQKHQSVALEYSALSNDIQSEAVSQLRDPVEFINSISQRINLIQRFGPPFTNNDITINELPNYVKIYTANKAKKAKKSIDMDIIENEMDLFMPDITVSINSNDVSRVSNDDPLNPTTYNDMQDVIIDKLDISSE